MSNTEIVYSGKVLMKYENKQIEKRNSGSCNLFRLISCFLSKSSYSMNSLPAYFNLYTDSKDTLLSNSTTSSRTSVLRNFIDVSSEAKTDTKYTKFTTEYIGTLTSGNLVDTNVSYSHLTLCLISADKNEILAAVDFPVESYNVVRNGGQVQLKWIMEFKNKSSSTT